MIDETCELADSLLNQLSPFIFFLTIAPLLAGSHVSLQNSFFGLVSFQNESFSSEPVFELFSEKKLKELGSGTCEPANITTATCLPRRKKTF